MIQEYLTNEIRDEEEARRRQKQISEMNLYLYHKLGNDARFVLDEDIGLSFLNMNQNKTEDVGFQYKDTISTDKEKLGGSMLMASQVDS